MEGLTKEELERIKRIVERNKAGIRTTTEPKKKPKIIGSYYERHREERLAYQNRYNREVLGYKPRGEAKYTQEEYAEKNRENARRHYWANREKHKEYNKAYYESHKEYFKQKSREYYLKTKGAV